MKHFCINHPSKKAVSFCHNCGEYYCADCLTEGMNYYYCNKEDCQVEFENDQKPNEETSKTKISNNVLQDRVTQSIKFGL